jgi:DNA-binding NarL/FixJ family response regulator
MISGWRSVCLSGTIPEFLSWRLSGFTLQRPCKSLLDVARHQHTQRRKGRRPAARALNSERTSRAGPQGNTGEKQGSKNPFAHGLKKSLTERPHTVSGKRLTKAKVLVVHRTGFVRSGVLSLIAKSRQFIACGETDEAPLARELFLRHKPDLVLIGLRLSGADGIQLIKEFRSLNPAAAVLALSEHADAFSAQRAFRAGARGYLSIEDAPELLRALDEISTGHPYVGASVLPLILSNFAAGTKGPRTFDVNNLSDRELEIFSFIGRGLSVSELANELNVSVKTIETHQMRIKEKLVLRSAAELRQKAREWLSRSALNRIREEPELEQPNGARSRAGF